MAKKISLLKSASQHIDLAALAQGAEKDKDFARRKAAVDKMKKKALSKWKKNPDGLTQNQFILRELSRAANRKMVALDKAGVATPAYKKASKWLGLNTNRTRFSTHPKALSSSQVERELYHVVGFLQSKTSTVSGYRQVQKKRNQTFIAMGISESDLDSLYNALKMSKFGTLLSSDQIIDLYRDADTREIIGDSELDTLTDDQKKRINQKLGRMVYEGIEMDSYIPDDEPALYEPIDREEDYI